MQPASETGKYGGDPDPGHAVPKPVDETPHDYGSDLASDSRHFDQLSEDNVVRFEEAGDGSTEAHEVYQDKQTASRIIPEPQPPTVQLNFGGVGRGLKKDDIHHTTATGTGTGELGQSGESGASSSIQNAMPGPRQQPLATTRKAHAACLDCGASGSDPHNLSPWAG
jgi:hypothetical protein